MSATISSALLRLCYSTCFLSTVFYFLNKSLDLFECLFPNRNFVREAVSMFLSSPPCKNENGMTQIHFWFLETAPPPPKKKKKNATKKHKNNHFFFQSYRLWSERKFPELSSHTFRSPPGFGMSKKQSWQHRKKDQTTNSPVYVITYHQDPLELWNSCCVYHVYQQQDGKFSKVKWKRRLTTHLSKRSPKVIVAGKGPGVIAQCFFMITITTFNHWTEMCFGTFYHWTGFNILGPRTHIPSIWESRKDHSIEREIWYT